MPQQKLTPAKVFTVNGRATTKHDDMLFLFEKKSKELLEYCKSSVKKEIQKIQDIKEIYLWITENKDGSKTAYKNEPFIFEDGYEKRLWTFRKEVYSYEADKFKEGSIAYKNNFEEFKENGDLIEIIDCKKDLFKIEYSSSINIIDWFPEKPLMNGKYYIGSVDLFVRFKIDIIAKYIIESDWEWNNQEIIPIENNLIFEFKPEIKSYSETLRQVNVYRNLLEGQYIVITCSDISRFQNIFEEQNIWLFNPKTKEEIN